MDMQKGDESQAEELISPPNPATHLEGLSLILVERSCLTNSAGATQNSTSSVHASTIQGDTILTRTLRKTKPSLRRRASSPSAGPSAPPKMHKRQSAVSSEEEAEEKEDDEAGEEEDDEAGEEEDEDEDEDEEEEDPALPPLPESPPAASLQPLENRTSNSQLSERSNSSQDPLSDLTKAVFYALQIEEQNCATKEKVSTRRNVSITTRGMGLGITPPNDHFSSFQPPSESTPMHSKLPSRANTKVLRMRRMFEDSYSEHSNDSPRAPVSSPSLEYLGMSDGEAVFAQASERGEEGSNEASGTSISPGMASSSAEYEKLEKQRNVNEWVQRTNFKTFPLARESTSRPKKRLQRNAASKQVSHHGEEQNNNEIGMSNYRSVLDIPLPDSSSSSEEHTREYQREKPARIRPIPLNPSALPTSAHNDSPRPQLRKSRKRKIE